MARPKITSQFVVQFQDGSKDSFVVFMNMENKRPKYTFAFPKRLERFVRGIQQNIVQLKEVESVYQIGVKVASNNHDALVIYLKDKKADFDSVENQIIDIIKRHYDSVLPSTNQNAPSTPSKMVYYVSPKDIDDLDVGDVIKYERNNGTIATMTITKVSLKGNIFITNGKYFDEPNGQEKEWSGKEVYRNYIEKLIKQEVIRDFIKATPNSINLTTSSQPNESNKIYGIIIDKNSKYVGQVVEVLGLEKRNPIEEECFYKILLNGVELTAKRNVFIVSGDGIKDKFWKVNFEVLSISENEIKLKDSSNDTEITQIISPDDFTNIQHNFYTLLSDKFTNPQVPVTSAPLQPPNTSNKIYGIFISGSINVGKILEVKFIAEDAKKEKYYEYVVSFQDNNYKNVQLTRSRLDFMVEGDIIRVSFDDGQVFEAKVLEIKNNETIKIDQFGRGLRDWSIGKFDFKKNSIDVIEFYNLHEIFESRAEAQRNKAPKISSRPLTDDEKEIENIKKDIANLIFLKSTFSPVEFEDTIKIGQKIDEKQKKINDLNLIVVDKKLKGNKIFDDLFEQSFAPIQNRYDVYISDETENTDFFAPNGSKSMLKNSLSSIIRTPLFKEWFGDWQMAYNYRDIPNSGIECSKVVNKDYEPLIVWHGTGSQFSYFRFDNFPAAYFAVKKEYSDFFAEIQSEDGVGYVMPFFLNLRNPLDLTKFETKQITTKDFFDYMYVMTGMTPEELEVNPIFLDPQTPPMWVWVFLRNNPKMLKKLADSHVYDGIHFYENNPNLQESDPAYITEAYITFKPDSCKIADPERGDLILASMKSFLLEKGGKI